VPSTTFDKGILGELSPFRKDNKRSNPEKQFKLDEEKKGKIFDTITTVTCNNCNVTVPVIHWDKHKTEVHMKGISFFRLLKEIDTADDGLDLKMSIRYMFKKL
jgi:hypothetical protein